MFWHGNERFPKLIKYRMVQVELDVLQLEANMFKAPDNNIESIVPNGIKTLRNYTYEFSASVMKYCYRMTKQ